MRNAAFFLVPAAIGTAALASSQFQPGPAGSASTAAAGVQAGAYMAPDINQSIADWRRLRRASGYAFSDYARFLTYNPGWPGETAMRRDAERQLRRGEAPATVLAFFASQKPLTGDGHAHLAEALLAGGRPNEAVAAAREAWVSADLGAEEESAIYARFGPNLTWQDHERRVDALLFDKKTADAARFLAMTSPARRPVFAARIALQNGSADAEGLFRQVAHRVSADAGLLMDRARYLRAANSESAARSLAAQPHAFTERPTDPDRFYEMLLLLAEGAAADGQWTTAYNIARQVDDSFPAGTDITQQSYGVRDKYTSLTWLAGTAALRVIGRPADAVAAFYRYAHGGKSLQVTTKGLYWAGRAALTAGRPADAASYFQRAAAYPELFYGQLALERLGRSVPAPPAVSPMAVSPAQRSAFQANRLVQATRQIVRYGGTDERSLFVRALSESLKTDNDRLLALELAGQIGREDLPVWIARSARNDGTAFYVRQAFPVHATPVPGGRQWSLTHGITRQESSFDRYAASHAGALGMMQLMRPTAREQAGKMGLGYDASRLTQDPAYNVMLGSAYFARLLNQWDGNVPLAVASYNAGAGNVRKWVRAYGDPRRDIDILSWIERIPFSETRGYVQRVIENSVVYDQLNPSVPAAPVHVSRYLGKQQPG